jgi:hypothetical protein
MQTLGAAGDHHSSRDALQRVIPGADGIAIGTGEEHVIPADTDGGGKHGVQIILFLRQCFT